MNRSVLVGVVALVVVLSIAAVGVPMTMTGGGPGGSSPYESQQSMTASENELSTSTADESMTTSQTFDSTTFVITVHENGSATWTFQHQQNFDDDNETEERDAFEEFAEEFEANETGLYERFTEQAEAMVGSGAERTDREMEATDFERSATVDDQLGTRGIVEMSFTWTEFATAEDGTVEVGDAFENIYIADDQAIEIEAGEGLTFQSIDPDSEVRHQGDSLADADSVHWSGERQFIDGHPQVTLVENGSQTDGSESESLISTVSDGDNAGWYFAIVALVVLATGGGAVWYRRQEQTGSDETVSDEAGTASDGAAATGSESVPPAAAESDREGGTDAAPLSDEELLTDEDRVVRLIRENGGRMKQVKIVEDTGWSKSKVSMLLSDMEEEGTISKLRVGRENIISLEGFEPEATKSPFEE